MPFKNGVLSDCSIVCSWFTWLTADCDLRSMFTTAVTVAVNSGEI